MKRNVFVVAAFLAIIAMACNQPLKKESSQITATTSLDATGADTLMACPHASKINWIGFKPAGKHTGTVNLKPDGIILVKDNQLVGINVDIDLTSITDSDLTDAGMNAKLIGHLKSPDFFNVDSFPTANFKLTGVTQLDGDAQFTHVITGDMTIKSITKPITFKAKIAVDGKSFSAESEAFMMDRTQWKVNYGSKSIFKELKDNFINDEFSIQILLKSM